MNKSSILLFSTLLLTGLAHTPVVAANTDSSTTSSAIALQTETQPSTSHFEPENAPLQQASNPATPQQPLSVQQTDTTLSITYLRSSRQADLPIFYGVWSQENGQDDIKWYKAGSSQTDIPLNKLGNSGDYSIHAYITINGKSTFLTSTVFALTQHTPTISSSISAVGTLDIAIRNLPSSTTQVLLPTWSDNNGQDDVIWHATTRNSDGTASLRIPLKQHGFDTGNYHTHFYIRENGGDRRFIKSIQTTVSASQLPAIQPPLLSVQALDGKKGTYRIHVQEQANTKKIKSVDMATWSMDSQANIKWRNVAGSNGAYSATVSFQEHQNHAGHYHNHVYVTYADGTRIGYEAPIVDLTQARVPLAIQTNFINTGNFQVKIGNAIGYDSMRYAVWSDTGGQDDLRWYEARKTGNGEFTGDIPLVVHHGNGTYHLHIYHGNTNTGITTFHVSEHQRTLPVTSYDWGECTWGAKTLAPWAGNYWGNGGEWADSARRAGFRVGTTPKIGAIAVWSGANGYGWGYGHVAVVTDVQSNSSIRVKESNYQGNRYIADFRGWFNPIADGVTAYIYPH